MTDPKPAPAEPAGDPQREAMRAAAKRIDRVNGWLHVGGALSSDEYKRFQEAGITHVVDLREEAPSDNEHLQELGIERRHVPVPDRGPPTVEQLAEVASWLTEGDQGAQLYVHCKGGFGRAATMAVGLLILHGSAPDNAVEQVRLARPEMRLNEDQLAWLSAVRRHVSGTEPEGTG
jgi:protein-tyrosine phosphatase